MLQEAGMRALPRSMVTSLALLAAGLSACSNDSDAVDLADASLPQPDTAGELADVTVSVAYAGTASGALVLGAFRSVPPMGPPLAFQMVNAPMFPEVVVLRDVEPGTVFVIAVLDRAPANPTRPGPEDLQAASGPLMLDGTDTSVSLTLLDP